MFAFVLVLSTFLLCFKDVYIIFIDLRGHGSNELIGALLIIGIMFYNLRCIIYGGNKCCLSLVMWS